MLKSRFRSKSREWDALVVHFISAKIMLSNGVDRLAKFSWVMRLLMMIGHVVAIREVSGWLVALKTE